MGPRFAVTGFRPMSRFIAAATACVVLLAVSAFVAFAARSAKGGTFHHSGLPLEVRGHGFVSLVGRDWPPIEAALLLQTSHRSRSGGRAGTAVCECGREQEESKEDTKSLQGNSPCTAPDGVCVGGQEIPCCYGASGRPVRCSGGGCHGCLHREPESVCVEAHPTNCCTVGAEERASNCSGTGVARTTTSNRCEMLNQPTNGRKR